MKAKDYEAYIAKLNAQKTKKEQKIRGQLETCTLEELLIETSKIHGEANAKILEYGVMQKKTFSPLPELVHDTSLPVEAQKSQLIDQYIEGINKVQQVNVAIKTKIERDDAMAQYRLARNKLQGGASQTSSSTAGSAEETEEKKSGPGLKK